MKQPKRKCEKWVPMNGIEYWYVVFDDYNVRVKVLREVYDQWFDKSNRLHVNTFRHKREAQDAARLINKILKGE